MVIDKVKKRAIYVYLPTKKQADKWKNLAEQAGESISSFVADHVENSLAQEEQEEYEPRAELRKRIQTLQEENQELRKQNRILEHAVDKLEKENRRHREKQWTQNGATRRYERELIDLIKEQGPIKDEDILRKLGIEHTESESVETIASQLTSLQSWGLATPTPRGWRWTQ